MSDIDIDAIQARADAATAGPWSVYDRGVGYMIALDDSVGDRVLPEGGRTDIGYRADAEFIAHAREDIPALVSLVRELQAGIPARVILDGDPDQIEAALDALPAGSIATNPDDPHGVFTKAAAEGEFDDWHWYQTGFLSPTTSRYLARYHAPLTVVR